MVNNRMTTRANTGDNYLREVVEASFDFSCGSRSFISANDASDHLIENGGQILNDSFKDSNVLDSIMEDLNITLAMKFGEGRGYQLPPMKFNMN